MNPLTMSFQTNTNLQVAVDNAEKILLMIFILMLLNAAIEMEDESFKICR